MEGMEGMEEVERMEEMERNEREHVQPQRFVPLTTLMPLRRILTRVVALLLCLGGWSEAGAAVQRKTVEFEVKPYLQRVTRDSVRILWRQTDQGTAFVSYRGKGLNSPPKKKRIADESTLKDVRISGLKPGTQYLYEVVLEDGVGFAGEFGTAVEPDVPFSFMVLGSTQQGRNGDSRRLVIDAMIMENSSLLLHTGDIVFRAKEEFYKDFFRGAGPLLSRVPMYPVIGSRDLAGSKSRGLALFKSFFVIPAPLVGLHVPDGVLEKDKELTLREGESATSFYSFSWGNSHFMFLDTTDTNNLREGKKWLEDELVRVANDIDIVHSFVVMNHGPYGSGPSGPNKALREHGIVKLIQDHGVGLVFSGKDGLYERGESGGVSYVVTGGGGGPLVRERNRSTYTQWLESAYHYVKVTVNGAAVEVVARRADGTLIDTFRYKSGKNIHSHKHGDKNETPGAMLPQAEKKVKEPHLSGGRPGTADGDGIDVVWRYVLMGLGFVFIMVGSLLLIQRIRKKKESGEKLN